jgi:hypothetical protein
MNERAHDDQELDDIDPTVSPSPDRFRAFEPLEGEDESEDDDAGMSDKRLLRASVWLLTIFLVVIMIGIPVLRALETRDNDPDTAIRAARAYVADRFTVDVLTDRSVRAAVQWARPSLHQQVEEIVRSLQASDPDRITGAEASHAPVACTPADPPQAECYQSWLRQPGQPEIIRIEFAVAIYDGQATVVALREVGTV